MFNPVELLGAIQNGGGLLLVVVYLAFELRTVRHDLINEGIASVLKRHGAVTQMEPQGWFLRTQPSSRGREGPDMLIVWGSESHWIDLFVSNTHPSGNVRGRVTQAACHKRATYAPAREAGVEVHAVGFSHLGVPFKCESFLSIVKSHSRQAVRELHNIVAVRAAMAMGLFLKKAAVKRAHAARIDQNVDNNLPEQRDQRENDN